MKQPFITLNNVSKIYNNSYVLKNVTYEFNEGLYVISGINGSGKSTLVKLITKIVIPTQGTIKTNKKVCYLSEKFELPRNMTSFSLINLYVKNKSETLCLLEEWKIANRKINSLSKGNFQKLGILLMICLKADIYIFDEPTDSLDNQIISMFHKYINILKEQGKCILIILHQLNLDNLNPIKIKVSNGELCES